MPQDEHEYMPKPLAPLGQPTAEQHIKNDFRFMNDLQTKNVEGTEYMTDKHGNFLNAPTRMTESEFINRWLDGFTLGRIGKQSYFDAAAWMAFTNQGTEGVVVVSDSDESDVLFIIPPIAVPQFTADEQRAIKVAGSHMANARGAFDRKDNLKATEIIGAATALISKNVSETPSLMSDYIPLHYFVQFGIIPAVRQNLVYCRDYFGLNPEHTEDWDFAEKIFTKIFFHEELTEFEIKFMTLLTDGKWVKPEYHGEPPVLTLRERVADDEPLSKHEGESGKPLLGGSYKDAPTFEDVSKEDYDPFSI